MKNLKLILVVAILPLIVSCIPESDFSNSNQSETITIEATNEILIEIPQTSTPDPVETEELEPSPTLESATNSSTNLQPTMIPCSGQLTSPNQEGPFYKAGSPERKSLIDEGMAGIPIQIFGRVFDQDCNPMTGVKLDFWQADVDGEYDNIGYTLRGHQFSDENGYFSIESIEPTPYTGRPSHIHVKLFARDGQELLTTQMYFPGSETSGDVQNAPDLLATYLEPDLEGRQQVLFNFIVQP